MYLVLDISSYNLSDVQLLKQELMGWDTKVISVELDNSEKTLTIWYNNKFNEIEFIELLGTYHMSTKSVISWDH